MKRLIRGIFSIKKVLCSGNKENIYFHPITSIKGYKKIILAINTYIGKYVTIAIQDGTLKLTKNNRINNNCNIYIRQGMLELGENSFLNNNCTVIVIGRIIVGKNVMIAPNCNLICGTHSYNNINTDYINQQDVEGNITIGDNVWIGANSCILGNIIIGDGSIIGAGSVLTKSVGKYEIWAGNPARLIKKYNFCTNQWEKQM